MLCSFLFDSPQFTNDSPTRPSRSESSHSYLPCIFEGISQNRNKCNANLPINQDVLKVSEELSIW